MSSIILTDSSGVAWQVSVNTSGSLITTSPASGGTTSPVGGITYTVQDIVNGASQDLRSQLATNSTILLDYVDRIHKQVARGSKWQFMLSDPLQFITEPGINDYWIGATGGGSQGSIETNLNLVDIYRIKDDSVMDRSNNTGLFRVQAKPPNLTTFENPDGQSRRLRPTNFAHNNFAGLLQIFPAPDNQNTYQPSPESPICGTIAGGALPGRTYFVKYTIIDSNGNESDASSLATTIFVPASNLLVVRSPKFPQINSARGISYAAYKVYAAAILGNEVVQNAGASIATGVNFTESVGGLATGTTAAPSINNLTPLGGYVMEFAYYKQRLKFTSLSSQLQIPDDYKDVLVAGVNWLGYMFLKQPTDAMMWHEIFQAGLRDMIRDKNQFSEENFMKPDSTTQSFPPGIIPGFITGN